MSEEGEGRRRILTKAPRSTYNIYRKKERKRGKKSRRKKKKRGFAFDPFDRYIHTYKKEKEHSISICSFTHVYCS